MIFNGGKKKKKSFYGGKPCRQMKNSPQLMRRCITKRKLMSIKETEWTLLADSEKSRFKFRAFIYQLFLFSIIMKPDNANCPQSKL